MPPFLLALTLLASSPQRDALLGTYPGENCYLKISRSSSERGETDVEVSYSGTLRTLWSVGGELESQLRKHANVLIFNHRRQSFGDMSMHVEISLINGRPASFVGTADGLVHDQFRCVLGQ